MAYISNTFSTNNTYIKYRLVVNVLSQNIVANTSTVNVQLQAWRTNTGYETYGTGTGSVKVGGTQYNDSITSSQKITYNSYTVLYDGNHTITHNADGTKSPTIQGYFTISGVVAASAWASFTFALPTIPRASTVSATNADIGSATSINIGRYSNTFTHTLKYAFGSLSGTIATGVETSYGWIVPTGFYAQIPNASSGTVTITCETYSGETLIGTSTTTFTATVNQATNKPDVSATIADTDTVTIALTGNDQHMVKYFSNAAYSITATPKNSATIIKREIVCGGPLGTTATGTLENVESGTFIVSATDSRGFTTSVTYAKTLIDYIRLTFNPLVYRPSPTSNEVLITFNGNYFNDTFGAVSNLLGEDAGFSRIYWRSREKGTETWSAYASVNATVTGNTFKGEAVSLGSTFLYTKSYEFDFKVVDRVTTLTVPIQSVGRGIPLFDWGEDNFVHNTPVEVNGTLTADATEVTSLTVNGNSLKKEVLAESCYIPVDFNYFLPNGTTVLTTSYPQLIPIYKASGGLSINSNIITLQGGYMYEFTLSFLGSGNGSTYLSVVDAVTNTSVAFGSSVNSISSSTSTAAQANSIQEGRIDLTAASDKTIKVINSYLSGAFSIASNYGTLKIIKYKKITI